MNTKEGGDEILARMATTERKQMKSKERRIGLFSSLLFNEPPIVVVVNDGTVVIPLTPPFPLLVIFVLNVVVRERICDDIFPTKRCSNKSGEQPKYDEWTETPSRVPSFDNKQKQQQVKRQKRRRRRRQSTT